MDGEVIIPLHRFKELEENEELLKRLLHDKTKTVVVRQVGGFGYSYVVYPEDTAKTVIESLNQQIKTLERSNYDLRCQHNSHVNLINKIKLLRLPFFGKGRWVKDIVKE